MVTVSGLGDRRSCRTVKVGVPGTDCSAAASLDGLLELMMPAPLKRRNHATERDAVRHGPRDVELEPVVGACASISMPPSFLYAQVLGLPRGRA